MRKPHATLQGILNGRKVYRFDVKILLNDSRLCATVGTITDSVLGYTAGAVADALKETFSTRAETEIIVYGPKGGKAAYRFVSWTSAIGSAMSLNRKAARQLDLIGETTRVNGTITEFYYAQG